MPLILNGNTIGSLYLGSAQIKEGYFGSHKVYAKGPTLHDHTEIELLASASEVYINSPSRLSKFTINGTEVQPSRGSSRYYSTTYQYAKFTNLASGDKIGIWGLNGWSSGDAPRAISLGIGNNAQYFYTNFKINFWGTSIVYAKDMFNRLRRLTAIPDSWDELINLQSAEGMFCECGNLVNGGISGISGLSALTNCKQMFSYCYNWVGDAYGMYQYLSPRITNSNNYQACFYSCTKAIGWSSIPGGWR